MASDVAIANKALIAAGEDLITSLTEDNKAARTINAIYEMERDAILRNHNWNFATGRVTLALLTTSPAFEFGNEFQLPADFLKMVAPEVTTITYKIEGRKLLTDEASIKIQYIKRITDPNLFDSLFIDALASKLAYEVAMALSDDKVLVENLYKKWRDKIAEARSTDAQEGTPDEVTADTWINVRL